MLNVVVWGAQILLAVLFVFAAIPKITGRGIDRWVGFSELPTALVKFIGVTELIGAVGLVLPMATGVLPWLTPIAAVGLALTTVMATGFHLRADERVNALETALWSAIAAVIVIARWHLVSAKLHVVPGILIAALVVLVPAVFINLVVLLRRPVPAPSQAPQ